MMIDKIAQELGFAPISKIDSRTIEVNLGICSAWLRLVEYRRLLPDLLFYLAEPGPSCVDTRCNEVIINIQSMADLRERYESDIKPRLVAEALLHIFSS
jgi:hypothetical protein